MFPETQLFWQITDLRSRNWPQCLQAYIWLLLSTAFQHSVSLASPESKARMVSRRRDSTLTRSPDSLLFASFTSFWGFSFSVFFLSGAGLISKAAHVVSHDWCSAHFILGSHHQKWSKPSTMHGKITATGLATLITKRQKEEKIRDFSWKFSMDDSSFSFAFRLIWGIVCQTISFCGVTRWCIIFYISECIWHIH